MLDALWTSAAAWWSGLTQPLQVALVGGGAAILGTAATSTVAILTIWLTNRAHAHRQKKDHDTQAKTAAKAHSLSIRKEVYLAGVESVMDLLTILQALANPTTSAQTCADDSAKKMPAIGRLHLVAGDELLSELIAFSEQYGYAFMSLMRPRIELDALMVEKQQLEEELAEIAARPVVIIRSGKPIPGHEARQRYNEISTTLLPDAMRKIGRVAFDERMKLNRRTTRIIAFARNELELDFDSAKYEKAMLDSFARITAKVNDFSATMVTASRPEKQ